MIFQVTNYQDTIQKNHLLRLEFEQSMRELQRLLSELEEWVERVGDDVYEDED